MEDFSNNDSWKNWFHRNGPKLLLCARHWTASLADAEDAVQDAFVRFWRRQRSLPGEPMALLLTSIRRAALDSGRSRSRRTARETEAGGSEPLFEPLCEPGSAGDDRRSAIEDALGRLPPDQREVLALKIWGGLTFSQIAQHLEIPPNTAASRYRYALAVLRRELTATDCRG
jgi:RNA polymerase sigma-70 factor (ECF subfamily)